MAKYSYEFKKKIVDAYLRGEGGYEYLSSVYGPHKKDIQKWVNNYQSFGDEGLMRIKCQVFMYKKFYIIMYNYSDGLI